LQLQLLKCRFSLNAREVDARTNLNYLLFLQIYVKILAMNQYPVQHPLTDRLREVAQHAPVPANPDRMHPEDRRRTVITMAALVAGICIATGVTGYEAGKGARNFVTTVWEQHVTPESDRQHNPTPPANDREPQMRQAGHLGESERRSLSESLAMLGETAATTAEWAREKAVAPLGLGGVIILAVSGAGAVGLTNGHQRFEGLRRRMGSARLFNPLNWALDKLTPQGKRPRAEGESRNGWAMRRTINRVVKQPLAAGLNLRRHDRKADFVQDGAPRRRYQFQSWNPNDRSVCIPSADAYDHNPTTPLLISGAASRFAPKKWRPYEQLEAWYDGKREQRRRNRLAKIVAPLDSLLAQQEANAVITREQAARDTAYADAVDARLADLEKRIDSLRAAASLSLNDWLPATEKQLPQAGRRHCIPGMVGEMAYVQAPPPPPHITELSAHRTFEPIAA
jgi:hypothetical protein